MNHQRTITSILNLTTGEQVEADSLLPSEREREVEIFQLRGTIEEQIQTGKIEHVCAYCKQPVALRGRKDLQNLESHFFFVHLYNSDDCPIKTGSRYSQEQLNCIKYNGVKESLLHETLKELIGRSLGTELGAENVWVDKVYKSATISKEWRKPDVLAKYGTRKIALELQLSTTYLSVIVGRKLFYQKQSIFLVWVFPAFSVNADLQKFTQKDVFYNNHFNVYVFDGEAQQKSVEAGKLILKCFYQAWNLSKNDGLLYHWEYACITLAEIYFNDETGDCFYINAEENRTALLRELEQKKREAVVTSCTQYIKVAYKDGWVPSSGEYYPFSSLDDEMLQELNSRLKFAGDNLHILSKLFYSRARKNFLCLVCEEKAIQTNFNAIEQKGRPLLHEIVHLENPKEFAFYVSRLFRKGYTIGPKEKEVIDELWQKNSFNYTDCEKEQVRRWAICQMYSNLRSNERAYQVMELEKVMLALASLKHGICIGNNFSNLLQLSHHFLEYHKDFGELYIRALKVYSQYGKHFEADKTGKFKQKVAHFNTDKPPQVLKYESLICELFPEL